MKKLVPGTTNIFVTDSGEFTVEGRPECDLVFEQNTITLSLFGRLRTVDKTWLMLIALFEVTDAFLMSKVRFVHLSYKKKGIPFKMVFTSVQWLDKEKKYRLVPGYPTVAVSADGHCIYCKNRKDVPVSKSKTYVYASVYSPIATSTVTISIHQLVALAWLPEDFCETKWAVNHKDGNKQNNHYTNLEWCSIRENNIHAFRNGLRPDNIHCYVKEIFSDEVIEFSSLGDMCQFLNMGKPNERSTFMVQYVNRVYNSKYEIRLEGDSRPWFYVKNKKIMNVEPSRYIITIYDNGEELIFNGARSIIKHYRVWNVNGEVNCVLAKLKVLRPDLTWYVVDQMDTTPIEVLDTRTGEIFIYDTVTDVFVKYGITKGDVVRHIRGNGKFIYKNLRIRRKSIEPWPKVVSLNPWKIRVIHKQSNSSKDYTSLRQVASDLKVDRHYVKRCIRRPKESDPYEITRIQID